MIFEEFQCTCQAAVIGVVPQWWKDFFALFLSYFRRTRFLSSARVAGLGMINANQSLRAAQSTDKKQLHPEPDLLWGGRTFVQKCAG